MNSGENIKMNVTIESLDQYVEFIQALDKSYALSRGQEYDKPLLPSVMRQDENGMRLFSNASAKEFIDEFKNNSVLYLDNNFSRIENDYEWIILAQHFGVPTCLLDFTYSHLVSLMFAVENAFSYDEEDGKESVVWFLNPNKLNLLSINRNVILNLSEESGGVMDAAKYPCVVTARKNNSRVAAQNGLFVFFQKEDKALDELGLEKSILIRVNIPHRCAKRILASLYTMGMRFKDIYPELTSVSKDILLKHNVMEFYKMEAEDE